MTDWTLPTGLIYRLLQIAARICALSLLWVVQTSLHVAPSQSRIDLGHYALTFDENFDALDVSPWGPGTRWIAHTPWAGDFGDAAFIDPSPAGPFKTSGGMLTITMDKVGGVWRSGLLASADRKGDGFQQSGGYFEIRAKLPAGPGVWPAFWLGAIGSAGKPVPEIDALEYYGQFPDSYRATAHVWIDGKDLVGDSRLIDVPANSLVSDFHTYGVSIDATSVIYYLDRREMARIPSRPEYLHPMFILLNLAAGSGWPIDKMSNPSIMTVDYVRAYKRID